MRCARSLRCYMSLMALHSMQAFPTAPRGTFESQLEQLSEAGFDGVQFAEMASGSQLACCRALSMGIAGSGRINCPSESDTLAERMAGDGYECATIHLGWGLEDDKQAGALVESVLRASERRKFPLYIETHRATLCQDMWRSVQLTKRFPEIRFNGDFSHWYAGQEMVYGGFERKLEFIRPVIERVRFLHGRIASPGSIQVPPHVGDTPPMYMQHFREMWTACFRAFLNEGDADFIYFTPELLGPDIFYARTFNGVEEGDRWKDSLVLKGIAQECFQFAQFC